MQRLMISSPEMGATNGGKGQFAWATLEKLLPLLTGTYRTELVVPRDAHLPALPKDVSVVRLPVDKNRGVLRVVWDAALSAALAPRARTVLMFGVPMALPLPFTQNKVALIYDIHPVQHRADPQRFPGDYSPRALRYLDATLRQTARAADVWAVPSESVRREVHEHLGVPLNAIHVAPAGVDRDRFKPERTHLIEETRKRYGLPEQFFLFVGDRGVKKNFQLIREAYEADLLPKQARLPVVTVGGERRDSAIGRSRGTEWVRSLGFVPDEHMPALYSAATGLVHPSFHEGFGMPPLEAMACGTPVATSGCSSLPEVVGNADARFDPHDAASLADALARLTDPAAREVMRRAGLERAAAFPWDRPANVLAEILLKQAGV